MEESNTTNIQGAFGLLLLLLPLSSFAERTQASAEHKAYPVTHPVVPAKVSEAAVSELKAALAPALAFTEEETRDLLRPMTGFMEMRCPNCHSGQQGDQLVWSIADPHRLKCRFCGQVYFADASVRREKYPMDKEKGVTSPRGERQQYPYYEGPDKYPYYFDAKIVYETESW